MRRVGFLLKVRPDRIEEYKQIHAAVWPEMLNALSAAGWHNYSHFLRGDGLLFGYFETPESLEAAQAAMAVTEVNERWQTMMSPLFELPEVGKADELLLPLEEVFHLD